MMKPLVTVIIPTFNRAGYVIDTLKSIAQQTYKHFECLIIDDGSTDKTKEVVLSFCEKDSRFKYLTRPVDLPKGANSCRNFGVNNSKGIFIAFCDDDDFWVPEKLEIQLAVFYEKPDVFVVTGDIEYVDKNGVKINRIKSHYPHNQGCVFEKFLIKNRTSMVTPLLKKEVFEKVGIFNTHFVIAEDWEFWRRVSYYYKFYSINKVLALVRLHGENISKSRSGKPFENYKLYRKLTKSLLKWGKNRFEPTDYKLIYKMEWKTYRKLMGNHYPGILKKGAFLLKVFLGSITDGFHLIYLIMRFAR
ncbi:glycosyltransferase family 2 protein [Lacinutrix himadriensis]|uniref:glycosyltransferase family 2 protein n=1 Tax=Lacinutrix himadriensis TaxID=641549 RepID=UPI0006E31A91|nr:glycosyltransferase [Lacinutrix himadriensis]